MHPSVFFVQVVHFASRIAPISTFENYTSKKRPQGDTGDTEYTNDWLSAFRLATCAQRREVIDIG